MRGGRRRPEHVHDPPGPAGGSLVPPVRFGRILASLAVAGFAALPLVAAVLAGATGPAAWVPPGVHAALLTIMLLAMLVALALSGVALWRGWSVVLSGGPVVDPRVRVLAAGMTIPVFLPVANLLWGLIGVTWLAVRFNELREAGRADLVGRTPLSLFLLPGVMPPVLGGLAVAVPDQQLLLLGLGIGWLASLLACVRIVAARIDEVRAPGPHD